MQEEKIDKEIIYEYLLDLTRRAQDPNRYFSMERILVHIKETVKQKKIIGAQQNQQSNGSLSETKRKADPRYKIPNEKYFRANLEALVEEGKAQFVINEIGTHREPYRSYRAVI